MTVALRPRATARSRSRSYCWVANLRERPVRALSTESGAWYEVTARVEVSPRRSWVSSRVRATVGIEVTDAATLRRMEVTSPTGSGGASSLRGGRLRLKKSGCCRSSGSSASPRRSSRIPV